MIEGWSPISDFGIASPWVTARNVVPGPRVSSTRSSQPVDAVCEPPFSRYCCASKWLRLTFGVETPGTKANSPVAHNAS